MTRFFPPDAAPHATPQAAPMPPTESGVLAWGDLAWSVVLVAVLVLMVDLLIPVAHAKERPAPPAPIFPALQRAAEGGRVVTTGAAAPGLHARASGHAGVSGGSATP